MKIIRELVSSQINSNAKDTLATRLTIFFATILLGTIIFIIGSMKIEMHQRIVSTIGDYQVSMTEVSQNVLESFFADEDIKKVSFNRWIDTELDATILEQGKYFRELERTPIISGKPASSVEEIVAPIKFLKNHEEYRIGSKLTINEKSYTIVGAYDDSESGFSENVLIGILDDGRKDLLLKHSEGLEVFIWYQNPRDTYTLTKKIFDDFSLDYSKAIDTGRLYFNKDILEYQMIYPSGAIPPRHIIADAVESYGVCMILVVLFAVMIYGAFNVWNNRDIRQLALLKSVGMTKKQVKQMIRFKVLKIGVVPILSGIVISYFIANLLIYLMWLNNYILYKNISHIFGEKVRSVSFHWIPVSFPMILMIAALSFLTVYLSAILPAIQCAKMNVVEGLGGISKRKTKSGKCRWKGELQSTLSEDYFKAYRSTYRTILVVLVISAMVMTAVFVSQAYRTVNQKYATYQSPYNFTSKLFLSTPFPKKMIHELQNIKGVEQFHFYSSQSFKFYVKDNPGMLSQRINQAFQAGDKEEKELYVQMIGLTDRDFEEILTSNGLHSDSTCLLLNRTPDNNERPYAFRKYMKIADPKKREVYVRYNAEGAPISVFIDGYIEQFPFSLEGQTKNGIYLFTRMSTLENLREKYGVDPADSKYYYTVQIKAVEDSEKVFEKCEKTISAYISKDNHSTHTAIMEEALNMEQLRNEHLLNFGIQSILIILALSNAYNSFHGNLRARKREFHLLSTIGMTEKQIKSMIYGESRILFRKVLAVYLVIFGLAVFIRSYRSPYELSFAVSEILIHFQYLPMIILFGMMALGTFLAIQNSIRSILQDDFHHTIKEIS